jgi:hypothetical protein
MVGILLARVVFLMARLRILIVLVCVVKSRLAQHEWVAHILRMPSICGQSPCCPRHAVVLAHPRNLNLSGAIRTFDGRQKTRRLASRGERRY